MSGAQSPQTSRPVGITKGPGEAIHEYTLISRDEQRLLKNGEYVYYELDETASGSPAGTNGATGANGAHGATPRRVLGRILRRVPVQLFPDTFLSEPEVSPSQVA